MHNFLSRNRNYGRIDQYNYTIYNLYIYQGQCLAIGNVLTNL